MLPAAEPSCAWRVRSETGLAIPFSRIRVAGRVHIRGHEGSRVCEGARLGRAHARQLAVPLPVLRLRGGGGRAQRSALSVTVSPPISTQLNHVPTNGRGLTMLPTRLLPRCRHIPLQLEREFEEGEREYGKHGRGRAMACRV